ncbi:MAG: restriction endonuclease [Clostridia bacterium]|nr:restriction endonuclease [Clostridia bacterium]
MTLRVWQETQNIVLATLTFGVSLGLLYVGIQKYKQRKRRILFESTIEKVENMSGIIFEEFLLEHFKHLGYTGYLTPRTENYGADLVLQKDEIKVVVQSKRWKSNVGADAVEQVIKAVKHYDAGKGMVVTNSFFTEGATELANSNEIELWDRTKLVEIIDLARGNLDKVSSVTEIKHNIEV